MDRNKELPKRPEAPPLIFSQHSVINATIYAGKTPSFTIISNKSMTRTDICDIPGKCIIATINRREVFSDTVTFPQRNNGKSVAINKWLRQIDLPAHVEPCTSLITESGNFVWKTDARYRLALYLEDDAEEPLAFVMRTRPPAPLVLALTEGYEEIVCDILVSFVILEHKLRMTEKRRQNDMIYGPVSSGHV